MPAAPAAPAATAAATGSSAASAATSSPAAAGSASSPGLASGLSPHAPNAFTCGNRCWFNASNQLHLLSACAIQALIFGAHHIVVFVTLIPWIGDRFYFVNALHVLFALCTFSFFRSQHTNPGRVPAHQLPPEPTGAMAALAPEERMLVHESESYTSYAKPSRWRHKPSCGVCGTIKPTSTHHCSTCGCCVMRMDHHCSWVNNCVGQRNQKYFVLFLVYAFLLCVICFLVLVSRFFSCHPYILQSMGARLWETLEWPLALLLSSGAASDQPQPAAAFDGTRFDIADDFSCAFSLAEVLGASFIAVGSLAFGVFAAMMIEDQLLCIVENTPGIDALQGLEGQVIPTLRALGNVMGEERFSWRWFVPTSATAVLEKRMNEVCDEYRKELLWVSIPKTGEKVDGVAGTTAAAKDADAEEETPTPAVGEAAELLSGDDSD